jgi:hypothetical protein
MMFGRLFLDLRGSQWRFLGGSTNSSMLHMEALISTNLVLWVKVSHRLRKLTMMRLSLQLLDIPRLGQ